MESSWITKADISQILKTYSIRKDEFIPVSNINYCYKSILIKGYVLTISKDPETERVIVSHSQDDGKRTYVDVWERVNNKLQFKFRNLWNQPLSDTEYIKDLEHQITELKQAGRNLQVQIQENQKLISDTLKSAGSKEPLKRNARGAGRKPSQKRLDAIEQVKSLLESGCSDQDIMHNLGISRATFYRYKKNLNN